MFVIRCETAAFNGDGRFKCHRCKRETVLLGDSAIVLLLLPTFTVLTDAGTNAVMHQCRPEDLDAPKARSVVS